MANSGPCQSLSSIRLHSKLLFGKTINQWNKSNNSTSSIGFQGYESVPDQLKPLWAKGLNALWQLGYALTT